MKLTTYRVTDFRSVKDSGWISTDGVTALIGENETGKTNLLLPLLKLNPVGTGGTGAIAPMADLPRIEYTAMRERLGEIKFIEAEFAIEESMQGQLASTTGWPTAQLTRVVVSRAYDGKYSVTFPDAEKRETTSFGKLRPIVQAHGETISAAHDQDAGTWDAALTAISNLSALLEKKTDEVALARGALNELLDPLRQALAAAGDVAAAPSEKLQSDVEGIVAVTSVEDVAGVIDAVLMNMPKFLYFASYGTIDTVLYLPQVIDAMKRDLTNEPRTAEKVRTVSTLFKYVGLKAEEILTLGREEAERLHPNNAIGAPNEQQMKATAEAKDERAILLMSAAAKLSQGFKAWWKRGTYTFAFNADGNYFNIFVSDDKRPAAVQLEGRSSGLQWFFSFFIVFEGEASGAHSNVVLLLDEPGVTLHPLAQEDLFRFFEGLAEKNQLLYTSHSPFLVDADRLSDVRVVYVNDEGNTEISDDLRAGERGSQREKALYAVDSALGLTVSRTIMRYASPTLVEGVSDQIHLNTIKTILIGAGRIAPKRELIFLPAGGSRAMASTAAVVGAQGLPPVLLDGDAAGNACAQSLRQGSYAQASDRIFSTDAFTNIAESEIEDVIPFEVIRDVADRLYHNPNAYDRLADVLVAGQPITPQIEAYCAANGIALEKPGWKVTLAQNVERQLLRQAGTIDAAVLDRWAAMLEAIMSKQILPQAPPRANGQGTIGAPAPVPGTGS